MSKCEKCGKESSVIITDKDNKKHELCHDCNNQSVADYLGIDNFKDFARSHIIEDLEGIEHEFEIDKEIFHMGIKWRAYEIRKGDYEGYKFEVYSDLEDDPYEGLQKLYKKIRKGLAVKYIEERKIDGQKFYSIVKDELVGRIEWDGETGGEVPKVIIDGKNYSWQELGKMLMGYEGFNLHLKMVEIGEDE